MGERQPPPHRWRCGRGPRLRRGAQRLWRGGRRLGPERAAHRRGHGPGGEAPPSCSLPRPVEPGTRGDGRSDTRRLTAGVELPSTEDLEESTMPCSASSTRRTTSARSSAPPRWWRVPPSRRARRPATHSSRRRRGARRPGAHRAAQRRRLVRAHLTLDSVWLRNSLRGALALGLAVLVTKFTGVGHAFWWCSGRCRCCARTPRPPGRRPWWRWAARSPGSLRAR